MCSGPRFIPWTVPFVHKLCRHTITLKYHALIEDFRMRTNIPAVLNTSFNIHGEPIVETPDDALDVFWRSGLTHLAIGNYLLSKTSGRR